MAPALGINQYHPSWAKGMLQHKMVTMGRLSLQHLQCTLRCPWCMPSIGEHLQTSYYLYQKKAPCIVCTCCARAQQKPITQNKYGVQCASCLCPGLNVKPKQGDTASCTGCLGAQEWLKARMEFGSLGNFAASLLCATKMEVVLEAMIVRVTEVQGGWRSHAVCHPFPHLRALGAQDHLRMDFHILWKGIG